MPVPGHLPACLLPHWPALPALLCMQVRKVAYLALAERVGLADMPTEDAALLIRRGLNDRAPAVRDAVANKLVATWLDGLEGEPLRLVHALNVQAHPGGLGSR